MSEIPTYKSNPKLHFSRMFNAMTHRTKTRDKYKKLGMTITREQFTELLYPSYLKLHKKWAKTGYKYRFTPSIDRIDNNKGYHIGNLQIIPLRVNAGKNPLRGEEHPNSKLSDFSVRTMRWLRTHTGLSQRRIGRMFGVRQSNVSRITRGLSRKNNK